MNHELPDVQSGFRKGKGTRDQIANIRWIFEKARVPEKPSISALLMLKELRNKIPWIFWIIEFELHQLFP